VAGGWCYRAQLNQRGEALRGRVRGHGLELPFLAQLCVVVGGEDRGRGGMQVGQGEMALPGPGPNVKNENSLSDGGQTLEAGGAEHGAPLRGCCVQAIRVSNTTCCVDVSGGIMLWMGEAVAAAGLLAPGQVGLKGMELSGRKDKGVWRWLHVGVLSTMGVLSCLHYWVQVSQTLSPKRCAESASLQQGRSTGAAR
jgi:hypothetical protein